VRIRRTVDNHFTLIHHLAVVHQHLLLLGNQELVADAFKIGDDQPLLALGVLSKGNCTGDFGQHAGVLGRTGFEQLGDARQTAGDVASLLGLLRNTSQNLAHLHVLTVAYRNERTNREGNIHRVLGTGDLNLFTRLVDQLDLRTHHGLAATRLRRDDNQGGQTSDFIQLSGNRNAFLDVFEAYAALVFTHDRTGERIPRSQTLTGLDGFAITHGNGGTIGNLMPFALTTVVVEDHDFAGARD